MKIGSGIRDAQIDNIRTKNLEMKAKWDAMTDEERKAINEKQKEQARQAEAEYLRKEKARQERYDKLYVKPQIAKDKAGNATKGESLSSYKWCYQCVIF